MNWIVSLSAWSKDVQWQLDIAQDHDDVIKWKYLPRYWPFVRGIHRSPVNAPHKGQWRGVLRFSLISARINGWVNNREAGDLRRHRAHYGVIVMTSRQMPQTDSWSLPPPPHVGTQAPGPRLNIKTVLSTYGDFHVKDKTAVRTSYL